MENPRFKNVLLFTSADEDLARQPPEKPYCSLGYIAEALRQNNIRCGHVDLRFKNLRKDFLGIIKEGRPDLIGTTLFSLGYKYHYRLLQKIRSLFPEIKIVVGGAHPSCLKEKMLQECPAVDYAVVSEGDETIIELCRGVPLKEIKGLLYRDNEAISYNGNRPFIADLDSLGFPKYEAFNLKDYAIRTIGLSTSRGCFAQCTFCAVVHTHGRRIRLRSAESVAEEIIYWYKRGYYIISVVDDNFVVNRNRILKLCEILKSNNLKGLQIKLDSGVRADCVDEELLRTMYEAGVNKLRFGVESANDHILRIIKKGETVEKMERAIRLALKVGMQVHLSFIIGLPGETEKDVRNSFEFAKRMKVHDAQFFSLVPYPATEVYEWARTNGYLLYDTDAYLNCLAEGKTRSIAFLLETPELSLEERKRLFMEGLVVSAQIKKANLAKILEPKTGRLLAVILSSVYRNSWFKSRLVRSEFLKRCTSKVRTFLNV